MDPIWVAVVAGLVGGLLRAVLGFVGEADEDEKFSLVKMAKTLVRALVGGAVVGYGMATLLSVTATEVIFFASLAGAVTVDLFVKNVTDAISKRTK